ncbi:MAG: dTDP-glucose 4,6-dehydratase [Kiritimatiellae bacterium]|nr:dTDP-glucose 4,6-dehydratase [Kiritimatiellia bacterium]
MKNRKFSNLLVTGGAGFIGSNFIRHLFEKTDFGGRVVNYDALTYAGNPHSLDDVAARFGDRYVLVHADIRDRDAIRKAMRDFSIDAICHFAAESHVDRSIVSPGDFVETNIVGTFNLLQAAREAGDAFSRFHHVSTDEVFGSLGPDGFFSETTPYSPHSPYSASKASSDHLVRAFHDTYGLDTTISNCSNNYGPYQFPEKLIPLMILNAREGKPLPVYGAGLNVRDWLHVEDHCAAIWTVMTQAESGSTYCVGGRSELTNIDVVKRICALVDRFCGPLPGGAPRESLITHVADRLGHDLRYAIDCSKLERDFGWRQTHTADSGFEETVKWYLENTAWVDSVRSGEYRRWIETQYGNR